MIIRIVPRLAMQAALTAVAVAVTSGAAMAQQKDELQEVTITGTREVAMTVGRTSTGRQVEMIQMVRRVSYADLDLATRVGAAQLAKRIDDAAKKDCKDLFTLYPGGSSGGIGALGTEGPCVKNAVDGAMVQAKAAMAAADKAAAGKAMRAAEAPPK
jgi:UrcA family protein